VESNQNVESKTKNVESIIAFLLQEIRKIIKIVATICQIVREKMHQNPILAGAPPQTLLVGELTVLPLTL